MSDEITIVLADDHVLVRSGLSMLLEKESDFKVLAEADDAEEALRKVRAYKPTILLLDLTMPGRSPIEIIPEVKRASSKTSIVILTMQSDPAYARAALRAGAEGYLLKEAADSELVEALRQVAAGSTYLEPGLGARLAREEAEDQHDDDLSEREREVLQLIALGHTNQEIAEKIFLSVRTVESHRAHIQQKLGLQTRSELVRYAIDQGLLDAEKDGDIQ